MVTIITSSMATSREGFTGCSFTITLPARQALDAMLLVLKMRTAQSHLSILTLSPIAGYFFLKYNWRGIPVKSKFSLNLFSTKRLYGSLRYWGRLQKKTNAGNFVGNCVMYLIFTSLPFDIGGGVPSIIGRSTSFSLDVGIFCFRF